MSILIETNPKQVIENKKVEHMAWGYTTVTVESDQSQLYHIHFDIEAFGSDGSSNRYDIKCALVRDLDVDYLPVVSVTESAYRQTIELEANEMMILVITAMPNQFNAGEVFRGELVIEAI